MFALVCPFLVLATPVAAGELTVAEEPGVFTIHYTGQKGAIGIPSWKAVLRQDDGGNISALHVPADHPLPVSSKRGFWPITILATRNSDGVEGMMSKGRENYASFMVDRFEITERSAERIIVRIGGPSKNRHFEHERTYTFTPRGVAIEGEVLPLLNLASIAFDPHWDLQQIADSHSSAVPMRTQGRHGWVFMPSSGSDGVTAMPDGVDFPLEVELRLRRSSPTYIRTYWDKTFSTHQHKRLFGHNNKDYTSPSGRTYHEKLLIIAGGPIPKGQRETYKVRYEFETRQ